MTLPQIGLLSRKHAQKVKIKMNGEYLQVGVGSCTSARIHQLHYTQSSEAENSRPGIVHELRHSNDHVGRDIGDTACTESDVEVGACTIA